MLLYPKVKWKLICFEMSIRGISCGVSLGFPESILKITSDSFLQLLHKKHDTPKRK